MSRRIALQKSFAQGKVVNLGCGENPCDFGLDCIHVDLDVYNYPNFVQADLHKLPFGDKEFDTAVMGDVLEHCYDPVQALREAGRVAKRVVATIFEEWRVEGKPEEQADKQLADLKTMGFNALDEYFKSLPSHAGKIVSVTEDKGISHHPHLWNFKDEDIIRMAGEAGLEIIILHKYQEGVHEGRPFFNWLLVAQ